MLILISNGDELMRHWLMTLLAALCLSPAQAQTPWTDEFVHIEEPQAEDVYVAGRDVEVVADLGQDLVAAGQRVSVSGRVGGDLIAAAETLILRGRSPTMFASRAET
ncbi:hypothetical protein [Marinobacterium aestuariivivens]|uniref:DUF5666 domain-containing protein n=1 Tax=Marinobacterium aestuariivivens TaxID=1698799 RepID=A0ABW2A0Y6_9GAMM